MDEIKKAIDDVVTASHGSGRDTVTDIFDGFMKLSQLVHKLGQEKAERARQQRNAKARKRYAIRKQLGIPTRKSKVTPEPEADWYEAPTSCYCSTCRMPPCGWCESSAGRDEEEEDA